MKETTTKTYHSPVLEEIGAVASLTAALGTAPRNDFSEFANLPPSRGSFDACDGDPTNNPSGSNCG